MIIGGLRRALADAQQLLRALAIPIDVHDKAAMRVLVRSALNTKFSARYGDLLVDLALEAVDMVAEPGGVDVKRHVRIEKIPGDQVTASTVLRGILLNKDVTHPAMRRRIEAPRIVLLDVSLEYKKGESQTALELGAQGDWARVLAIEEEQVREACAAIVRLKPDLVVTEKGISDLAQHCFVQAGITALRRVKKMDNLRLARATGATIVSRVEDLKETDVGLGCGLFHIQKIGDEYFSFFDRCEQPKACTIVLRGASKDVLHELDRDLQDALAVARNVHLQPSLVPGGGAIEMALAVRLAAHAKLLAGLGVAQPGGELAQLLAGPYKVLSDALLVVPRILVANCGANVIRVLTELRAKHVQALEAGLSDASSSSSSVSAASASSSSASVASAPSVGVASGSSSAALKDDGSAGASSSSVGPALAWAWGVDGLTGALVQARSPSMLAASSVSTTADMLNVAGCVWEPLVVKLQTLQTAVEAACMLLRVDDIVSGTKKKSALPSSSNPSVAPSQQPQGQEDSMPQE